MAEDYVIGVTNSPLEVNATAWDALLQTQANPSPFMRHAYLAALHQSGSATAKTGWWPHFFTLHISNELVAACALYEKTHSYGEYVHLCTLRSFDQMKIYLQSGYKKGTAQGEAKHRTRSC